MKRLLLLRHAKAVPADGPLADLERPLAPRGERDARHIGERLARHYGRPGLIVASPATRAQQTAKIVATAVGYDPGAVTTQPTLYLAEPPALNKVIAAQPSSADSLLVVGHNPGLTELAQELLPGFDIDDLPTAAAVGLVCAKATAWSELADARLAYYDFPKNPGPPATSR